MEGDDILMAKFAHDGDLSLQSPELRGAFPELRDEFQCHDLCRKQIIRQISNKAYDDLDVLK